MGPIFAKPMAIVVVFGSIMSCLMMLPPADAASGRAANFSVDIHIYNSTMADVALTGVDYGDSPLTISANVTIAQGQPDCPDVVVHFYVNTVEQGTGSDMGPVNGLADPMFAVGTYQWMPSLYGSYNITVVAMNATDQSTAATTTLMFNVYSSDLQLHEVVAAPTFGIIGQTDVTVSAVVHDHGNKPGHGNVSYWLDGSQLLGSSLVDVQPLLTVNATLTTNFSGLAIADGLHTVTARLVDLNPTASVSNNISLVKPAPDVQLLGMNTATPVVSVARGATVNVPVRAFLINNGTGPATGFSVYFYETDLVNPLASIVDNDVLDPGDTGYVYWNWTITDSVTLGDHVVWAGVAPQNAPSYFANLTVTVMGVANVTVLNITATPASATEGENITLNVLLFNSGTADADNVTVNYFDGTAGIGSRWNITVPANQTAFVPAFSVNVGNLTADILKTYSARVGSSERTVTVTSKDRVPRMDFTSFTIPPVLRIGDTVTFTATVHNSGNADAINLTVGFYDGTVWMNSSIPIDLTVGSSATLPVMVTISGAKDSNHTFFAKASGIFTHVTVVTELGETNATEMVGHALAPASVDIESFSVKPGKLDNQPVDSEQGYTLTVSLMNSGEVTSVNCTLVITEGKKVLYTLDIVIAGGANWTNTYKWTVKGSGDHKAVATLSGADAGPTASKSVKCTLNYTPGFEVLLVLAGIGIGAMIFRNRKK